MKNEFINENGVLDFFALLEKSTVRWLLLKNIAGELPKRLRDGKDIDILVHPDDKNALFALMKENGFLYRTHPFGPENGWGFAYGLERHQFWQKKDCKQAFYIDVCFSLCVKSLMPKTWVPLDQKINSRVWQKSVFCQELGCRTLDPKTSLAYLFARAVFDKRSFSAEYIEELEKLKALLYDDESAEMLKSVFYKFTPELLRLAKKGQYGQIVRSYFSFREY